MHSKAIFHINLLFKFKYFKKYVHATLKFYDELINVKI
jgi:hypothetical protein